MKKQLSIAILLLCSSIAFADEVKKADKDNDGTLDKKEITDKKIVKSFDQIDTDADGTIDAKELAAYFEKK